MSTRGASGRRWRGRAMAWAVGLVLAVFLGSPPVGSQPPASPAPVIVLDIDGAIGPATTEYVRNGLETARAGASPLVVLRMDTPGGLDSATRDIIADILASPVPVATFVAPAGARAASAGTYILYASHLAAMAPGTHLGAATPVQIGVNPSPSPDRGGGEPEGDAAAPREPPRDPMSAKAVNDAAAYIASLADLQGRNAAWAELAVREAATLTAEKARAEGVVELLAPDMDALLAQAGGRTVQLGGKPHRLQLAGHPAVDLGPGWRIQALAALTNPNIAYLLLLVGMYGLFFEFMSPGGVGPGVVGIVALLVGLFALNLLPVNYAGLALLLVGVGLMAAEAFTPSFGVLGIGGAVAFGLGSLFLFKGPLPEFRLSPGVVLAAAAISLAYFGVALSAAARARRGRVAIGPSTLIGAEGRVRSWAGDHGLVQVEGEDWQARAAGPLSPGQRVRVARRDGLSLIIEPASDNGPTSDPTAQL